VNPVTFTIVDATGRQTTAQLINAPGTTVIPPPTPPAALAIVPASQTAVGSCASKTFVVAVSGGTPSYNVFATPSALVVAGAFPNTFNITLPGAGTFTVTALDSGSPQKTATATITCT
jgi:hypothetical protein